MMPPDVQQAARMGLAALALSALLAAGLCWYNWSDSPDADAALAKAVAEADKLRGKELLALRVERQRAANQRLRDELAQLKKDAGFALRAKYVVPEQHAQPGQYFKDTYVEVRDGLRNLARAKNVEPDEVLGFPDASRKVEYAAGEVPLLLAMLQLTEKALSIMLQAPDPVERYLITHTAPIETGPADRPPLLREYPLRLEVTGSLKTILTILHRLGQIDGDDDYPLIVRGLTISSENTKARDDVQQLRAVIEIAGMQFLSDAERGETPAAAAAGSGGSPRAGTARP